MVAAASDAATTIAAIHRPHGWAGVTRVGARVLTLILVAATMMSSTGCSLHLHSSENAKRARAALDTFEKLKVDSVVTTGRVNMAELSRAQLETRQRVSEVGLKVDLVNVIGPEPRAPRSSGAPDSPLGWSKLESETRTALRPFRFLDGSKYSPSGVEDSRAILYRSAYEREVTNELRVYRGLVEEYKRGSAPGTQDPACKTVLAIKDHPRPANEPVFKWDHYTTSIGPTCMRLMELDADLKRAEDVLKRDPAYDEIVKEIDTLEAELRQGDDEAKDLLQKYEAAKKALAVAQEEAAKRTVAQQTAAAKAEVEAAQAKLGDAVKAIGSVVEASQKAPELVQVQIKTDVLETILSNTSALSGDPKAAAAKPTQQLLAIVQTYPDVAGRFKAADVPSVNVLLLELAIQRLHYRRLQADRDTKKDVVAIRKLQRDAYADSTAAWIRVLDGVMRVSDLDASLKANVAEAFNSAKPIDREHLAEVLVGYAVAKLSTEDRMNVLNSKLRDRYRAQSLEMTEIAIGTWNDLIRAPLSEITAYHEGGITSEELARLVNALGIMAIAVGVYQ